MSDQFVVYGLYDPRDGELRYIGQTSYGLKTRLAGHRREACANGTRVMRWVHSLLAIGLEPVTQVLESCSSKDMLAARERSWIAKEKPTSRLTNLTDGGEGHFGFSPSEETRAKHRANSTGRVFSTERRQRISEAKRIGWAQSPERREAYSKRMTGQKKSEAHRAAIGARSRECWADPVVRNRILDSRRNSPKLASGRLRQAEAIRGRTRDPRQVEATAAANRRKVIDQNGIVYESVKAAAAAIGAQANNVSAVARGKHRHTKGYVFRYVEVAA